ncbi:MAG: flagellin lysine-N-methylase [Clostridia bacterium]|nr:flagellin lysine-N-methylase [Clostridia bacterium]
MKIFAPKYYTDFSCIAGACRHSCCIGWEIDIDAETAEKYRGMTGDYAKAVRESIEPGDPPHFRLGAEKRCPHLDETGLCRIILACGEDNLCEICREHPRFYHDTCRGREVGLGMACEEACRRILSSDGYAEFVPVGEGADAELPEFDAVALRTELFRLLSDRDISYADCRKKIAERWRVSPSDLSDEAARELLSELEYLDPARRVRFLAYSSSCPDPEDSAQLRRALAYFLFRHCSPAQSEAEFRAGVGFALFCERLLASIAGEGDIAECARMISEELEYSEENTEAIKFEFVF